MEFRKTSEKVTRPKDPSYFMIREFSFDNTGVNVLKGFMETPFFCWKEEYRNEVHASIGKVETIVDWNFHGLFDIAKLKPDHFEIVPAPEFVNRFIKFIGNEIRFDSTLLEIELRLKNLIDLTSDFYIIKRLPGDFRHKWTVFDFFISGFKIDITNGKLTAIEFGLD